MLHDSSGFSLTTQRRVRNENTLNSRTRARPLPMPLHDEAGIHGPAPRGYGRGVPSSPPVAVVRDENDKTRQKR